MNHKDGIKSNNNVSNLEYCSQAANNQHAISTGLRINPRGSRNGGSKLTEEDVAKIKKKLRSGEQQAAIAKAFSVSRSLISQIALGRIWKES